MISRTVTVCSSCLHENVCYRHGRPEKLVESLQNVNLVDDNGLDVLITCKDFLEKKTTLKELKINVSDR